MHMSSRLATLVYTQKGLRFGLVWLRVRDDNLILLEVLPTRQEITDAHGKTFLLNSHTCSSAA